MASDLLSIARSGTRAARVALDVTAQNIANASSEGYVRRSASLAEVAASSGMMAPTAITLAGVAVTGIVRNADLFRQAEVRRTGADAARAGAELDGLQNVESAIEQTGLFQGIVDFEASLSQLVADPVDGALRAAVLEKAGTMAQTFRSAATSLDAAGEGLRFEAGAGVDEVNRLAADLARVNLRLSRAAESSSDRSMLLDQRDTLLDAMSRNLDLSSSFGPDGTVAVRLGSASGPALVAGGSAGTLAATTASDGTLDYTLDGVAVSPASGALAGYDLALSTVADTRGRLDALAASIVDLVNTAQANGTDLDGNPGAPLLAGTGAADMALVPASGRSLATAPAGAAAGSRDDANLAALRLALTSADPAGAMDALLFDVSSTVAGRTVTRDALDAIAGNARVALQAQAGVDLDEEAVNLVRFQQAFQASSRVMQVAQDTFSALLAIR